MYGIDLGGKVAWVTGGIPESCAFELWIGRRHTY